MATVIFGIQENERIKKWQKPGGSPESGGKMEPVTKMSKATYIIVWSGQFSLVVPVLLLMIAPTFTLNILV